MCQILSVLFIIYDLFIMIMICVCVVYCDLLFVFCVRFRLVNGGASLLLQRMGYTEEDAGRVRDKGGAGETPAAATDQGSRGQFSASILLLPLHLHYSRGRG